MTTNPKVVAIVQARTSSTRLPGKVLKILDNKPMIIFELERIKLSKSIDEIVLATSNDTSDDLLAYIVDCNGYNVFRGELNDVLKRYTDCSKSYNADVIVRITGDCPFIDSSLIDEVIAEFLSNDYEYISNTIDENNLSVPDGCDIEVFSAKALINTNTNAKLKSEREHVTPWMRSKSANLKFAHYIHKQQRPYYRLTIDDQDDFDLAVKIVSGLKSTSCQTKIDDVIEFLVDNPSIAAINKNTIRNEGYINCLAREATTGEGQSLWKRAKKLIPGGNMLLSKRAEMFLPEHWPSYFSKAKGCKVWDLDGRELIDMSIMGIGTNLLGYSHPVVDLAVSRAIQNGNMSTLNCPDEVYLAERLIKLHPWADMVRYARSGGEANAIAIRIARAATGKEVVAICGYHGWHDWYLATNLQNESGLEEHLLPGLEPNGVPHGLAGTVHPFSFNRLDQLESIASAHELAAVKMEVQRNSPPDPGFLEGVRELCTRRGIVLIFDECTSGFRETFGGLHLKYDVQPDMAMFGKALGNGYAITATIGRRAVMEAAQSTFSAAHSGLNELAPLLL